MLNNHDHQASECPSRRLTVIAWLQRLALNHLLQYVLRELQGKQREIWPQLCCFHTRCVLSEPTVIDQMWGEAEAPYPHPFSLPPQRWGF